MIDPFATTIASLAADTASALGILFVGYQLHTAAKQRKKESSEVVWDLLAADDIFMARMHVQTCEIPRDFNTVKTGDPEWFQAASKCFLAYQKVAQLVLKHGWMKPRMFAERWGFSTLMVWTKLEGWIKWYRQTYDYPGFGRSLEDLVEVVRSFQKLPDFQEKHYVAPLHRREGDTSGA